MSDSPFSKIIKLEFESDENFSFPLASNLLINFDNEHFYIRFYQATPPAILGAEVPDSVKAKLIGGVAIPASRMRGVVDALTENYNLYIERVRKDADFGLDDIEGLKNNE